MFLGYHKILSSYDPCNSSQKTKSSTRIIHVILFPYSRVRNPISCHTLQYIKALLWKRKFSPNRLLPSYKHVNSMVFVIRIACIYIQSIPFLKQVDTEVNQNESGLTRCRFRCFLLVNETNISPEITGAPSAVSYFKRTKYSTLAFSCCFGWFQYRIHPSILRLFSYMLWPTAIIKTTSKIRRLVSRAPCGHVVVNPDVAAASFHSVQSSVRQTLRTASASSHVIVAERRPILTNSPAISPNN